jgi:putative ABC transport system permease protein
MLKYLPLVWAGLWRKPVRTVFTFASIVIAFLLFGLLQGVDTYFGKVVEDARLDRLLVQNRIRVIEPLPRTYQPRLAQLAGVAAVTHSTWFGGYYQSLKNFTASFAVDIESFVKVYPEVKLPAALAAEMSRTATAAVIGPGLARRFGWRVGDQVTLQSATWTQQRGEPWRFRIIGVYGCDGCISASLFLINYSYFNMARTFTRNTVGQFVVRVDNPRDAGRIAFAIDELFANSQAETRTQSEQDSAQAQLKRIGDVSFFVRAILGAVFFALLLLTSNTAMQSFRERTPEYAVLKTVGYSDATLAVLVTAEALVLSLAAAAAGLMLATAAATLAQLAAGMQLQGSVPVLVLLLGLLLAVLVAAIASAIPSWRASRLSVVAALAVQ